MWFTHKTPSPQAPGKALEGGAWTSNFPGLVHIRESQFVGMEVLLTSCQCPFIRGHESQQQLFCIYSDAGPSQGEVTEAAKPISSRGEVDAAIGLPLDYFLLFNRSPQT